jgi:anti-anti-sigma factor
MTNKTWDGSTNTLSSTPGSQRPREATALAVTITDVVQGVIVRLEGQADLNTIDRMESALVRLVIRHTPLAVLDCSELTFLASLAMGVLVTFHRARARWGGRVVIAGVRPEVYEALRRAGLTDLFQFCATIGEATAVVW